MARHSSGEGEQQRRATHGPSDEEEGEVVQPRANRRPREEEMNPPV